jgi:hypothetical protein
MVAAKAAMAVTEEELGRHGMARCQFATETTSQLLTNALFLSVREPA